MSPNSQRDILVAVTEHGPLTAISLAMKLDLDARNVANVCSSMAIAGLLDEHPNDRGGRRGRRYGAAVDVHPRDRETVKALTEAYGAKAMRKLVRFYSPRGAS